MTADELHAICDQHAIPVTITGLVREADAARLCDVDVRTLRGWRRAGTGPAAVRLGGWRYALADLADALTPPAARESKVVAAEVLEGDASAPEPHPAIVKSQQVA